MKDPINIFLFIIVCSSLLWIIFSPGFEPWVAFLSSIVFFIDRLGVDKFKKMTGTKRNKILLYSFSRIIGVLNIIIGISVLVCAFSWLQYGGDESLSLFPKKFLGDIDISRPFFSSHVILMIFGVVIFLSGLFLYIITKIKNSVKGE